MRAGSIFVGKRLPDAYQHSFERPSKVIQPMTMYFSDRLYYSGGHFIGRSCCHRGLVSTSAGCQQD